MAWSMEARVNGSFFRPSVWAMIWWYGVERTNSSFRNSC